MKLNISYPLLSLVIVFSSFSCASYQTKYYKSKQNVGQKDPNRDPAYTLFMIGDAGHLPEGNTSPALTHLEKELQTANPDQSGVLFLGDNIYPDGMPDEDHPQYQESKENLSAQLDILKDFGGTKLFIPGNHDWRFGMKGVKNQEKFIEDYLDEKDVFLPENGCAGPELVELTDELVLIVFDSEWWLQDWDDEPTINAECDVKTRHGLIVALTDMLKDNRQKDVILAFHHPLYTYGVHGGKFPFKDHVFPFTCIMGWIILTLTGNWVLYLSIAQRWSGNKAR